MARALAVVLTAATFVGMMVPDPSLRAATPPAGTLSQAQPTLTWQGELRLSTASATCGGPANAACDNFALTIDAPSFPYQVRITLTASPVDDWDLEVYDADGELVGSSGNAPGSAETVVLANDPSGSFTVSASPYLALTAYQARAEIEAISGGGGAPPGGEPLRFRSYAPKGLGELDPAFAGWGPARGEDGLGLSAGEPTLGVPWVRNRALQQGEPNLSRIMYIAVLQTLRLEMDSCTSPAIGRWHDKSCATHVNTLDPILHVQPETGRTISTQLAGKTSLMCLSDDDGDTWTPGMGAGINSGVDHQTVGGGPFPPSDPIGGIGYDYATYYASQDIAIAQAALSRDGGLTFGPAVPMWNILQCRGLHGHIQVSPDPADYGQAPGIQNPYVGSVFVPNGSCLGGSGFGRSTDGGLTWTVRGVPGMTTGDDPGMGVGADGTVYFGTCGNGDRDPLVAVSLDNGDTWSAPANVGAALGIVNCVFPSMVAGDGDRAAFFFLGSTTPGAAATGADPNAWTGEWHPYVAVTYDRGASWSTVNVSPGDPVQRGPVCLQGTLCESNRNLLDFNDVQIDEKGRVYAAYADGCVGSCVGGGNNSGTAYARIARQEPGSRGLFAAFDAELAPASGTRAPSSPYAEAALVSGGGNDRVELIWAEPFDGNAALTGFDLLRSENGGAFAPLTGVAADVRAYTDSAIVSGNDYCYKVIAHNAVGASDGCYSVCAEAPPQLGDACLAPGRLLGNDTSGEAIDATALGLKRLFAGEPFLADPQDCQAVSAQKLEFNIAVGNGAPAAGNAWLVIWNRVQGAQPSPEIPLQNDDRNMISVRMVGATPQCRFGRVTAPSVNLGHEVGAAFPATDCKLENGTLSVRVPTSVIDDCPGFATGCVAPGYELAGLEVRSFAAFSGSGPIAQATASDVLPAFNYGLVGNDSCRPNAAPSANPDVFVIDMDAPATMLPVLANDTANDCDTIAVTAVGAAQSGLTSIVGDAVRYEPDPAAPDCTDQFAYTIDDGNGQTASTMVVLKHVRQTGADPHEHLFAHGFDGLRCPNLD